MQVEILILILILSATGGFIQRVCGFGFGVFVMLFFPHIISPHTAASAISTLVACFMSVYNAFLFRKHIPYKKVLPLIIGAFIMIPIAVRFSVLISGDFFKKLLGIVLICLSIYFLFFNQKFKIKSTFKNGIIAGGLGGTLNGLFSTGGPPIVLYLMSSVTDKTIYFASTQFYFAVAGVYSVVIRIINGIVTKEVLIFTAIGFIGCMVGNFIGKFTFDKLNGDMLRKVVYAGMVVSGLIMII